MGGKSARVGRVSLAVVFGLLSVFLRVDQASAHNSLTGSSPENGARLATAPARIELTFLARLDPATTQVTVVGPDNVPAADGAPAVSGSKVSVSFRPGAAGLYTVGYQVASSDGHPVKGEIKFTLTVGVTPTEPVNPTGSADPSPGTGPSGPQPAITAGRSADASPLTPSNAEQRAEEKGAWWPWLLSGVVLLALLLGVLLRRRSRAN